MMHFLKELSMNNSLEWMHAHKQEQKEAVSQFTELVQMVIDRIAGEDPSIAHLDANDLLFRMNRDTRFSHDKSPYNPSLRAHIGAGGKLPIPVGYYIHLSWDEPFLGGGLWASQLKEATVKVRNDIAEHGDQLQAIVEDSIFQDNFTLIGEKLKNVPRGYDADSPYREYLKHKSWAIEYPVKIDELDDLSSFADKATEIFLLMKPFNDYFNKALEGFQMPVRK